MRDAGHVEVLRLALPGAVPAGLERRDAALEVPDRYHQTGGAPEAEPGLSEAGFLEVEAGDGEQELPMEACLQHPAGEVGAAPQAQAGVPTLLDGANVKAAGIEVAAVLMAERELAEERPVDAVEVLEGRPLCRDLVRQLRGCSGRGGLLESVEPVVHAGLVDAVVAAGVDPPTEHQCAVCRA